MRNIGLLSWDIKSNLIDDNVFHFYIVSFHFSYWSVVHIRYFMHVLHK